MKKTRTRIISFLLCLLMVMGSIYELPLAVSATAVTESGTADESVTEDTGTASSVASDQTSAEGKQPVTENQISEEETTDTSSVSENTPSEPDTENTEDTDAENIDDTVIENTDIPGDTVTPNTVQVTFYDSDKTTIIHSATIDQGCYLSDYFNSSSIIKPVRRGYALDMWYCVETNKSHSVNYLYDDYAFKSNRTYIAQWATVPYKFDIKYNLNGGQLKTEDGKDSYPRTFTVKTETFSLPSAQRKGYLFAGWYTDSSLTRAITAIPKGTYINSDQAGNVAPYSVYAKWTALKTAQMKKPTAKNSATGKIKVSFIQLADADGYEITYSTDKKIKKNTLTKTLEKNKSSLTLSNLPKGGKYYFKVRAYKWDSTGAKCYGPYSAIASCKVTKGVKEYTAKSNSGKLKNVSIKNGTDLYVRAVVSKRLKSSDDFYYLVKVDPNTGKILKQISKTDKTKSVVFQLPLKDDNGNNHIQGKFGVAVKKSNKYMLISSTSYISNPEAAASYTGAFPTPASKKGRQGFYDSSLGDKNYFFNFNLNKIIGTKSNHSVAYKYNGKTYYFNKPSLGGISRVNQDGGTVTMQVMLEWDENCKDLILKSGRKAPTQNPQYYAFNTDQKAAREKLEAAFCFLAEELSKEDCHVDNWILGNEVNTYANPTAKWYYAGNISKDKFIKNYASTFRMLYYAVRSNSKNSRVYICCDHTWINREQDWGTKYFTEAFNKEIKRQNKNIKWNLAYHAYSAVLTNADFWNDGKLAPNSNNADFVSPNNLEILTNYVKKNFGKDVRIILSEQGFSCSGGVGSPYNKGRQTGESVQAAAIAWLYYKAQFNDMIDAVIFMTSDHGGAAGFQFDVIGRKAENVYKYMDTPKYDSYTKNCLKTIGKSSWSKAVKGFDASKLKKMPNR